MDIMIGYRPWFANENISCPFVEPLHRDQSTFKQGFHCVQGMLILKDVKPEIGGLQIVPGTNSGEVPERLAKEYLFFFFFGTVLVNLISPSPRIQMDTLRTGQFFIVLAPCMMTKIRKKQFFVILSRIHLPCFAHSVFASIYTLSILSWYAFNKNDIKN